MNYQIHNCGTYNIHTIKTDKFKNIRIEIVFRNNVDKLNQYKRTILFDLLTDCNKEYDTRRKLVLKLESLYNACVYSQVNRLGSLTYSKIVMDFLNPKYTEDDYLEDAIKLPFDLIFNPNITNNAFDDKNLDPIKSRVIADIKCITENPQRLALKNSFKSMDSESISSIDIKGTIADIESLTTSSLYETYLDVLDNDYVDIYIIGDFDETQIINVINQYANFKQSNQPELGLFIDNKKREEVNNDGITMPFSQSHLVYIYNTFDLTEYERKYVFNLYTTILGGGSLESKLYKKLRDENSLCYSVFAGYQKYDNLMFIYTSMDKKNISKAKILINETVSEMSKITKEDLEMAKKLVISSITMSLDEPSRIIDQYLFHNISELDYPDERIEKYNKVTLEEIKEMNNKIKLNTIYLLEGDINGEN